MFGIPQALPFLPGLYKNPLPELWVSPALLLRDCYHSGWTDRGIRVTIRTLCFSIELCLVVVIWGSGFNAKHNYQCHYRLAWWPVSPLFFQNIVKIKIILKELPNTIQTRSETSCFIPTATDFLSSACHSKIVEMTRESPLLSDSSQCAMSPCFLFALFPIAQRSLNPVKIILKPFNWHKIGFSVVLTSKGNELNSFTCKCVPVVFN